MKKLAIAFVLSLSMQGAYAQCTSTGGIPFNCHPGTAIGDPDLFLGGQAGNTVKFTAAQIATYVLNKLQNGSLPTSCSGRPTGTWWNNGNTVSICP